MPTISVSRDLLYKELGLSMSESQFDELCFEFGIELDEVTSESKERAKEQGEARGAGLSDEVLYKIEIPANRNDMLCLEGLATALQAFLHNKPVPKIAVLPASTVLHVRPQVAAVRPYVVAAVLRDIAFTKASYGSFIDLQDKLHSGIGRRRTIVSMGTHDLDTLQSPFTYEARPPEEIIFKPLNTDTVVNGHELMHLYETDLKIKKFLPIIRDSSVYPVIYDRNRTVCSLPPIINSDHSKISLKTKSIFIEVTGTDLNKVHIALNMLVAGFSRYCARPNTVEAVQVVYPDGTSVHCPDLRDRVETVSVEYINRVIGLDIKADQICRLLKKMMLEATAENEDYVCVTVNPYRSDVLHRCDIVDDVATAYGFNNLVKTIPATSCIAAPFPINKLTDLLRREVALAGFSEVYTFTLCSHAENFSFLGKKDTGKEAVVLANPKTIEFQVVQTSLAPQMLKTLAANKKMPLPIRMFQILDVVLLDDATDVGARNERRLCALYCDTASGFEAIHGLLDLIMLKLGVSAADYKIKQSEVEMYFPGRQASIYYKDLPIGTFGIVHPTVMKNFEASFVCSLLEINIEPFL